MPCGSFAQEEQVAEPATPVRDESFASPRATMKTLLTRLKEGDLEQAYRCFVEPKTNAERDLLHFGLSDDAYLPALHRALAARFGEDASPLEKSLLAFELQLQVVDALEESIEGDHARLAPQGLSQGGIPLTRVGDDWKIAIQPSLLLRSVTAERLPTAKATRAAYLETIQQLAQGKFASANEAIAAVEARKRTALGRQRPR
jgi:hypothetical protein